MRNLNMHYQMKLDALKSATGIDKTAEMTRTMINNMIRSLDDMEYEKFKKEFDKLFNCEDRTC